LYGKYKSKQKLDITLPLLGWLVSKSQETSVGEDEREALLTVSVQVLHSVRPFE
jgi:hypothetical protein